jgi:PTH1 family peptidyl-tRNA hydrolase
MHLLIGLGNPGAEYRHHRHNIGFLAVDAYAQRFGALTYKNKFHGQLAEASVAGQKLLLLKPQTFMNRSGLSALEVCSFYKIAPENCLVIHDELDLPFGTIKVKLAGGHAGHNGLKDLDRAIGQNYWRLRFGIGHPGDRERVTGHVLSDFDRQETQALPDLLKPCLDLLEVFVTKGGEAYKQALHHHISLVKTDK